MSNMTLVVKSKYIAKTLLLGNANESLRRRKNCISLFESKKIKFLLFQYIYKKTCIKTKCSKGKYISPEKILPTGQITNPDILSQ